MSWLDDVMGDVVNAAEDVADYTIPGALWDQLNGLFDGGGSGGGSSGGGGDAASASPISSTLIPFEPVSDEDIAKTLIDPASGVISDERIAELMPNWQEDALTAVNWNEQQFGKVLDMAYGRAAQDTEMLNALSRAETSKMNEFLAQQFDISLDKAMPGIRKTAALYQGSVQDMLSGELPISTQQQIASRSSEQAMSRGLFGEAGRNLTARDLGLSSIDYVSKGQAQMDTLMGVTKSLTAPTMTPTMADTGALASQYGSTLLNLTTMSPTAAAAAGAQQSQIGIGLETFNQQMLRSNQELNVNRISDFLRFNASNGLAVQQSNQQMDYAAALSNLNYNLDQQAFEWNYKTAQMQADSSEQSSMYSAIASLFGTAVGAGGALAMTG
jgi:predicted lactoylglutathione lyase